ncbi:hypothetical protein VTK73DRAFT_8308 [Phialemonium thermophilum]|uniref:Uncharacterized protein n=1 Tax=Phialemonium thermophilum TaxID=223376 RepID=A0ABR3W9M9_9PEZI
MSKFPGWKSSNIVRTQYFLTSWPCPACQSRSQQKTPLISGLLSNEEGREILSRSPLLKTSHIYAERLLHENFMTAMWARDFEETVERTDVKRAEERCVLLQVFVNGVFGILLDGVNVNLKRDTSAVPFQRQSN